MELLGIDRKRRRNLGTWMVWEMPGDTERTQEAKMEERECRVIERRLIEIA